MEYIIAKGKLRGLYIEIKLFIKNQKLVIELIDPEKLNELWKVTSADKFTKHLLNRYEYCEGLVKSPLPYSQYPKDSLNYIVSVMKSGFFDKNECDVEVHGKLKSINDFYEYNKDMKY